MNCVFFAKLYSDCNGGNDVTFTANGLVSLTNALHTRKKHSDSACVDQIERCDKALSLDPSKIVWHRKCHAGFTNKTLLNRIIKKKAAISPSCETSSINCATTSVSKKPIIRRTSCISFNSAQCMFCQIHSKEILYNISCLETSSDILQDASSDFTLRIRLANVTDLVAAEGNYYLKCLQKFRRSVSNLNKRTTNAIIRRLVGCWMN